MAKTFYLEIQDSGGSYQLACQMLETTTGPFYAVKGQYLPSHMLNSLVEMFKEKGINVLDNSNDELSHQ